MSSAYEQFAKDTYETVYNAAQKGLSEAKGEPILIVSGEEHSDNILEKIINFVWTDDEDESPAHAAAYTHVAAIKAAEQLVGKYNMVVSVEQDPDLIKDMLSKMDAGMPLDFAMDPSPTQIAFMYAYENGYTIVGTDAGYRSAIQRAEGDALKAIDDPQRYAMENAALSDLADRAKVVVHVGGAAHIKTLQGYLPTDDFSDPDNLPEPVDNPFGDVYGRVIFFNSDEDQGRQTGSTSFYRDPKNAIQIDAPGRMDDSDRENVGQRIEEAATLNILEHRPEISSKLEILNN